MSFYVSPFPFELRDGKFVVPLLVLLTCMDSHPSLPIMVIPSH